MPKMKSKRGAAKRFKKRASGSIKRKMAYHSHMLTKKSRKRKRSLRHTTSLDPTNVPAVKKMILG